MKFAETVQIAESLPYESKLAFIAFCLDRCLKEAQLHAAARHQLEKLPMLKEALFMLWARSDDSAPPSPQRVAAILEHLSSYESPAADNENAIFNYDYTLVQAAHVALKGLRCLREPALASADYVASAGEGPYMAAAAVYKDYRAARNAEAAVKGAAILKLAEAGPGQKKRSLLDSVPDWTRGEISKQYADQQLKGSADEDE